MFNFTFGGWICFALVMICLILWLIFSIHAKYTFSIAFSVLCIILVIFISCIVSWYNTNTASGQRAIKDNKSNMEGGLNRKITIYYYGNENPMIFEGKIDLRNTDDNKVLEFVLDGKKYIYYIGILDRYIVEEK